MVRDFFAGILTELVYLELLKIAEGGIPFFIGKEKWNKRAPEIMLLNEKYTGTVTLLDSASYKIA